MSRKPSREDLEREIARLRPYETLHALKTRVGVYPVERIAFVEAHGARYRVTVGYYGRHMSAGGVVEVIAQPVGNDGAPWPDSAPIAEVYPYDVASRGVFGTVLDHEPSGPVQTAPWGALIRWVLTDGHNLANHSGDRAGYCFDTTKASAPEPRSLRARAIVARCGDREGYRITTGPHAGAFFAMAPDVEGRAPMGVDVEVRYNPADQFAFEVRL